MRSEVLLLLCAVGFGFAFEPTMAAIDTKVIKNLCFTTSDGVKLCYWEGPRHNPQAPVVVLIPGWTMPASIWERQLAYLYPNYMVVAFDPRGQGTSDVPKFGYSLERRVKDIAEFLQQFPDDEFVLVGWSLGALEALGYVDQHGTERIKAVVLVDNSIGEGQTNAARKDGNKLFEQLRKDRKGTVEQFTRQIFRTMPSDVLFQSIVSSALRMDVEDSIRLLSYPKPRSYWNSIIYSIKKPIFYMVTPKWKNQAIGLLRKHPSASAAIFEDAGHTIFWDQSDRFNQELDDFLQKAILPEAPN